MHNILSSFLWSGMKDRGSLRSCVSTWVRNNQSWQSLPARPKRAISTLSSRKKTWQVGPKLAEPPKKRHQPSLSELKTSPSLVFHTMPGYPFARPLGKQLNNCVKQMGGMDELDKCTSANGSSISAKLFWEVIILLDESFCHQTELGQKVKRFQDANYPSLSATLIKRFMLQRFLMEKICSVDFSGKSDVALAIKEWA